MKKTKYLLIGAVVGWLASNVNFALRVDKIKTKAWNEGVRDGKQLTITEARYKMGRPTNDRPPRI